jgi:eukaryotic-like serine/threonine-protein kinase
MHPERWRQIKEILDVSLSLDPAEREEYLTRVCESDRELRVEIDSLIEAHQDAGDLFDTPPMAESSDPMLGARLGAYQIVECIGSGGMGSVYRAVRADDLFRKEVAIKIVHRGLDLERVVRQFRRERQITASLNHPNIATLIDGGATPDGLPYFVMEFIHGKPIDTYCEEHGLSVRERLQLFVPVCAAVQFAQERGVVHRDIKPGNILVTSSGVPKLLDFGIAKILNPEVFGSERESTATLVPAMTPGYASPEQISGGPVTEASDVYSMGVLLYELLVGKRPLTRENGQWGVASDEEPVRPSKAAPGRGISTDLDKVVLMAMRQEPSRRYRSAGFLGDDIRRCLDSLPVRARQDTVLYRASKLVRRRKSAILPAAAALALAIAAFVILQVRNRISEAEAQPQITLVTSLPGLESQPYFAPDGKHIVYVWSGENGENSDIYVQSLEDGSVRRITTDPAIDVSPVWSPDGSRIAWLRTGTRETAVFVSNVNGGIHGKVADVYSVRVEALGRNLDWSPDGKFIAAADKSRPEFPFHIVLIGAADGSKREATVPPDGIIGDMSPAFSPDGQWLAFLRAISSGVSEVYVAPAKGGPARRLTFDNRSVASLAWTPDSRSIVFASERRGNSTLWRIPRSGGTPERVPMVGENAADPVFSRAGWKLAYTQFFLDANIWRVDPSGREAPVKVISSTQYDSSPQYSPDGGRVAFRSTRSGSNEIWVSDADGRTPVQLTRFGGPLTGCPRWSPDGMRIAFDTRPEGQADIYVIASNGGVPKRLTSSTAEDVVPSWSRDGAWIYFASNRTGAWQVWRVPSGGGVEEQLTHSGGFAAFPSPDGKYLYYAKGRSAAGLWRKHLPDGAEEAFLEQLKPGYWGYWAVSEDGVYFADEPGAGSTRGLYFCDFATRHIRQVSKIEKTLAVTDSGLALSPDRQRLLYTQVDQSGSDILIMDHYR